MIPRTKTLVLSTTLAISARTHPSDKPRPLTEVAYKNAHSTVKNTAAGLTVEVRYSRFQFVSEMGVLLVACRPLITARANQSKARSLSAMGFLGTQSWASYLKSNIQISSRRLAAFVFKASANRPNALTVGLRVPRSRSLM
jgi:hypothetical protein